MKKVFLLSMVALAASAVSAQEISMVQKSDNRSALTQDAVEMTAVGAYDAGKSAMQKSPRKAYADGVMMMRPEGSFYSRGTLTSGEAFTSILVPPFVSWEFTNLCTEKDKAVWSVNGTVLEAEENGNVDYTMSKGSSAYSLYYAPSISVDDVSFSLVDFVQPIDSTVYSFCYLNTAKTGNYYSSNGSPFMTEDIAWDFDEDGTAEPNKSAGIRQLFIEKPLSPLVLNEIYFPFYSTKIIPVPAGQKLKAVIRKLGVDEEGYLKLGDVIAEMEVASEDIEKLDPINSTYGRFAATFASYEEDDFGTLTAKPIIIDDMFAIDILGFDGEGVEVQTFWAKLEQDEAEYYTNSTRATLIVCNDLQGKESGTLRYDGVYQGEPYRYNAVFYLYGEMDGIGLEYNNLVAPVAGGESLTVGEGDDNENPAYLFTNFPIFEEDGSDYVWADNYDFEGVPEWAALKISPRYYDNPDYTNVRGLHLVWFECEALPEGETGRSAVVKVVSVRGAEAPDNITIVQGDADITGVGAVLKYDAEGNFVTASYNMAGQRVDNSFKGLVIKNGKKFMNK